MLMTMSIGLMAASAIQVAHSNVQAVMPRTILQTSQVNPSTSLPRKNRIMADDVIKSVNLNSLDFVAFGQNNSPAGTNDMSTFSFSDADGSSISLDLIGATTGNFVPAGTYSIQSGDADFSAQAGYVKDGWYLTGCYYIDNTTASAGYYLLTGGSVTVSYSDAEHKAISIALNITGVRSNNDSQILTLSGTCSGTIPDEPEFMVEGAKLPNFTQCTVVSSSLIADVPTDNDTILLTFSSETEDLVLTYPVIVAAGTSSLADGTYTIAGATSTPGIGDSFRSQGLKNGSVSAPYALIDDNMSVQQWFFIMSGHVTITNISADETRYELNVASYNGTNFIYDIVNNLSDVPFLDECDVDTILNFVGTKAIYDVYGDDSSDVDIIILKIFTATSFRTLLAFAVPAGSTVIPVGHYNVETSGNAGTLVASVAKKGNYFYPSAAYIAEGWLIDNYSVTDGSVDVTETGGVKTYDCNVISHFGSEFHGSATLKDADAPYILGEPQTPITINLMDISGGVIKNKGDKLNLGLDVYEITFAKDDEIFMPTLQILMPSGSTELAAGTYPVNFSNDVNTGVASLGYLKGCRVDSMKTMYGMQLVGACFYMKSGTINVVDDPSGDKMISGTMTSHFGSTFNFSVSSGENAEAPYTGFESTDKTNYTGEFTSLGLYYDADRTTPKYPTKNAITYQFEKDGFALGLIAMAPAGSPSLLDGVYPIDNTQDDNTILQSSGVNDDQTAIIGSFAIVNAKTPPYYFLTSGSLTISTVDNITTFTIDATSHYGSTFKMSYTMPVDGLPYSRESNVAQTISKTGLVVSTTLLAPADENGYKAVYVDMSMADKSFEGGLMLYVTDYDSLSGDLANGTYTISNDMTHGGVLASAGFINGMMMPSFCASLEQDGTNSYYDDMYFLKSGTLTVDWDGHNFTLDAITYYGTHITLTGLTTGVDETKVGTSMLVYAENGSLTVENAQGSIVTVFNILGEKLAEEKVENGQAIITGLNKNAVYVVKSGSEIQKIGL